MTTNPPTGEGYFWWTNLSEHTPTILRVKRSYSSGKLYADNGEYSFEVGSEPEVSLEPDDEFDEPIITVDGVEYYHGTSFWSGCIELPELNGEFILPDSF